MSSIQSMRLCSLDDLADTNPESLSSKTDRNFHFRYVDLSSTNVGAIQWNSVAEMSYATSPSRARRVLRAGDVLFGSVRPNLQSHGYFDGSVLGIVVASTGFTVIRAKDGVSDSRYLFHCVMSSQIAAQANRDAVGSSYPALNDGDVRRFEVFAPPIAEQVAIGEILDTLDTTIRQTEAIIEKLKQVKQGLLHDLLTRGIGANGELRPSQSQAPHLYKDSPLGWIPIDWSLSTLSALALNIGDGVHYSVQRSDKGVPFLFVSCIRNGEINWGNAACITRETYSEIVGKGRPSQGMILFTVVGSYGHVAHVDSDRDFGFERNIAFVVPNPRFIQSKFLFYSLSSEFARAQVEKLVIGNAQKVLTLSALNGLLTHCPSPDEQIQIHTKLDGADDRIGKEIELCKKLREQKAGLMDDLLTGRVRVTALLDTVVA